MMRSIVSLGVLTSSSCVLGMIDGSPASISSSLRFEGEASPVTFANLEEALEEGPLRIEKHPLWKLITFSLDVFDDSLLPAERVVMTSPVALPPVPFRKPLRDDRTHEELQISRFLSGLLRNMGRRQKVSITEDGFVPLRDLALAYMSQLRNREGMPIKRIEGRIVSTYLKDTEERYTMAIDQGTAYLKAATKLREQDERPQRNVEVPWSRSKTLPASSSKPQEELSWRRDAQAWRDQQEEARRPAEGSSASASGLPPARNFECLRSTDRKKERPAWRRNTTF